MLTQLYFAFLSTLLIFSAMPSRRLLTAVSSSSTFLAAVSSVPHRLLTRCRSIAVFLSLSPPIHYLHIAVYLFRCIKFIISILCLHFSAHNRRTSLPVFLYLCHCGPSLVKCFPVLCSKLNDSLLHFKSNILYLISKSLDLLSFIPYALASSV
jgi:hypothetical protein